MCPIAVTSWCTARVATLLLGLGRVAGRAWLGGWQGCRRLAPAPQGTPSGGGGKHSPKAGGATGTCFQAPPVRTHAKGKGHMLSSHFQVGGVHGNRLAPHGPREPWPRPHNIDRFGASLGAAMWTFAGPRCHLGGFPQPWHRALWPIRPPKLHAGCWGFVCAPSHGLVFTVPHPMPPGTTLCRKPSWHRCQCQPWGQQGPIAQEGGWHNNSSSIDGVVVRVSLAHQHVVRFVCAWLEFNECECCWNCVYLFSSAPWMSRTFCLFLSVFLTSKPTSEIYSY